MEDIFTPNAINPDAQKRFVIAFFNSTFQPDAAKTLESVIMQGGVNPEIFGDSASHLIESPLENLLCSRSFLYRNDPVFKANERIARILINEANESLVTLDEYNKRMADRVAACDVFSREIAAEIVIATINNDLLAGRKPYEPKFDAIFFGYGDAINPFHLARLGAMKNIEDTHAIVKARIKNPTNAYEENLLANKGQLLFWTSIFSPPSLKTLPMPSQDFIDGVNAFGDMVKRIGEEFRFSADRRFVIRNPEKRFFDAAQGIDKEISRIIRRGIK